MLGLRTVEGIDLANLRSASFDILKEKRGLIALLENKNLISRNQTHLWLTLRGMMILDEITLQLME